MTSECYRTHAEIFRLSVISDQYDFRSHKSTVLKRTGFCVPGKIRINASLTVNDSRRLASALREPP